MTKPASGWSPSPRTIQGPPPEKGSDRVHRGALSLAHRHRAEIATAVVLFLALGALYLHIGVRLALASRHPDDYYDLLFGIDTPRVIGDMTRLEANHYRTKVHPLYVLLVNPVGVVAKHALSVFMDATSVAIALTALVGALNAVGAFALFRRMGVSLLRAAILACVFALSMSQLVLSSVPDTSSLATLSLVTTYLLFWGSLQKRSVSALPWLAAGVFSLGVTTTNFAQTLICHALAQLAAADRSLRVAVSRVLRFALAVVAATGLLALLQKALYPSASLFFLRSSYAEERAYTSLLILADPRQVLSQLAKQFFVDSVAGPVPRSVDVGQPLPGVTFGFSADFSLAGHVALALWFALGLAGALSALRRRSAFSVGLALCVAFNLALHSVYGIGEQQRIEYFLYSGNVTLAILALLLGEPLARSERWVPLVCLALALALNNLGVTASLIALYDRP